MYNQIGESLPEYDKEIIQPSNQVVDLQNQVMYLNAQLQEKDNIINQLLYENSQLKAQLQQMQENNASISINAPRLNSPPISSAPKPPPNVNLGLKPPPTSNYQPNQIESPSGSSTINKRKCPKCGAMGFDIKEFDDKTKIISYVPRRIYARKKVCIKCRYEF